MKNKIKIVIDIIMYAIFIYLMGYRQMWNLNVHAILGVTLFILFIVHNIVNLKWYKVLFKGKYHFQRVLLTVIDLLLLIAMIGMISSSILLSGAVTTLSNIPMTENARILHIVSTAWGFVLMSAHLALHLKNYFIQIENKLKNTNFEYCYYLVMILLCALGVYLSVKDRIWYDMFLLNKNGLASSNNMLSFIIGKVGIALFFSSIFYVISLTLKKMKIKY